MLPSITWSRSNGDLNNNSRITISMEIIVEEDVSFVRSTLQICHANVSDSDQYMCEATAGSASDRFNFQHEVTYTEGKSSGNCRKCL